MRIFPVVPWDGVADKSQQNKGTFQTFALNKQSKQRWKQLRHNPSHEYKLLLCSEQKYYCETCCSKQEAQKRMRVKKLPMILALHLKRFKYMEQLHRYTKLSYRVVFPLELRLFNTSSDAVNLDRMYDLVAVVVHCGSGPNRGHYITIVKSHGFWLLFDDDIVEKIDAQAIEEFYGLTSDISKNSESGYILFYQSRE
ncbi:ubiquitin carboxyl-terminal hydrolase 46-like [Meles meles]|uniref:ubiquitin carboxyl-terminal hydrolase 46-like n=1 Tax=Meles meles TaxID=9662 RepID=UPI001E69F72D|nr:ubiquitin carboxyl-terminal hydrolase 46-like [Meles meles]